MDRHRPAEVRELKQLEHDPQAQQALAARLLNPRKGLGVVQAAVDVLIRHPLAAAKVDLLNLYAYYTQHENRDPACYMRSRIVLALRPLAVMADLPFLWEAATTYAFPPPQFTEEGSLLRANALLVLADVELEAARYAATRLLVDEHTAPMSGEPAVTAAQVLAEQSELLPLYAYLMQSASRILPEVGAQALRGLVELDQPMLGQVIARMRDLENPAPALLVGLIDLVLGCEEMPADGETWLVEFLQGSAPVDLYRYAATLLVTSGKEEGWAIFTQVARHENVAMRREILLDALAVALDPRRAAALAEDMRQWHGL